MAMICQCFVPNINLTHEIQAPKAADIDEEMKPVNRNIKALSDQWVCHKKLGCLHDYCYPNPGDGGSHIRLTFPLLECWAAAMVGCDFQVFD